MSQEQSSGGLEAPAQSAPAGEGHMLMPNQPAAPTGDGELSEVASEGGDELFETPEEDAIVLKIVAEIIETEEAYIGYLRMLIDLFIKPLRAGPDDAGSGSWSFFKHKEVTAKQVDNMFPGIEKLHELHSTKILPALEGCLEAQTTDVHALHVSKSHKSLRRLGTIRRKASRGILSGTFRLGNNLRRGSTDSNVSTGSNKSPSRGGKGLRNSLSFNWEHAHTQTLAERMAGAFLLHRKLLETGYIKHIDHFNSAIKLIANTTGTNRFVREVIDSAMEQKDKLRGQTIHSLMIMPVQRITRYELFVRELTRKQEDGSREHTNLDSCGKVIKRIISKINESKRKADLSSHLTEMKKRFTQFFNWPGAEEALVPGQILVVSGVFTGTKNINLKTPSMNKVMLGNATEDRKRSASIEQSTKTMYELFIFDRPSKIIMCKINKGILGSTGVFVLCEEANKLHVEKEALRTFLRIFSNGGDKEADVTLDMKDADSRDRWCSIMWQRGAKQTVKLAGLGMALSMSGDRLDDNEPRMPPTPIREDSEEEDDRQYSFVLRRMKTLGRSKSRGSSGRSKDGSFRMARQSTFAKRMLKTVKHTKKRAEEAKMEGQRRQGSEEHSSASSFDAQDLREASWQDGG